MSSAINKKSRIDSFCKIDPITTKLTEKNLIKSKFFLTLNELMRSYSVCKSWNNSPSILTFLNNSPNEVDRISQKDSIIFKHSSAKKVYTAFIDALPQVRSFSFQNNRDVEVNQMQIILSKLEIVKELKINQNLFGSIKSISLKSLQHLTLQINTEALNQIDVNNFWSQPSLISLKIISNTLVFKIFECNVKNPCPQLVNLSILQQALYGDLYNNLNLRNLLGRLTSLNELTLSGCELSVLSKETTCRLTVLNLFENSVKDFSFLKEANKLTSLHILNKHHSDENFDNLYKALECKPNLKNLKISQWFLQNSPHTPNQNIRFFSLSTQSTLLRLKSLKIEFVLCNWNSIIEIANQSYNFNQLKFDIVLKINPSVPEIYNIDSSYTTKSKNKNKISRFTFLIKTLKAINSLAKNSNLENVTLNFTQTPYLENDSFHYGIIDPKSAEETFVIYCLKSLASKITKINTFCSQKEWTRNIFNHLSTHPLPKCTDIENLTFPGLDTNPNRRKILRQLFPALLHYGNITLID